MASPASARRLRGPARLLVLAAAVAALAGCVGMPSNGPVEQSTVAPTASAPAVNFIGPFPSGPRPGGSPSQIVQGFLLASASYPVYSTAEQYLASGASQTWNPGWAVRVYNDLEFPQGVARAQATQSSEPAGHGHGQRHAAGQLRRVRSVRLGAEPEPGPRFVHLQPAKAGRPVADHQPARLPDPEGG